MEQNKIEDKINQEKQYIIPANKLQEVINLINNAVVIYDSLKSTNRSWNPFKNSRSEIINYLAQWPEAAKDLQIKNKSTYQHYIDLMHKLKLHTKEFSAENFTLTESIGTVLVLCAKLPLPNDISVKALKKEASNNANQQSSLPKISFFAQGTFGSQFAKQELYKYFAPTDLYNLLQCNHHLYTDISVLLFERKGKQAVLYQEKLLNHLYENGLPSQLKQNDRDRLTKSVRACASNPKSSISHKKLCSELLITLINENKGSSNKTEHSKTFQIPSSTEKKNKMPVRSERRVTDKQIAGKLPEIAASLKGNDKNRQAEACNWLSEHVNRIYPIPTSWIFKMREISKWPLISKVVSQTHIDAKEKGMKVVKNIFITDLKHSGAITRWILNKTSSLDTKKTYYLEDYSIIKLALEAIKEIAQTGFNHLDEEEVLGITTALAELLIFKNSLDAHDEKPFEEISKLTADSIKALLLSKKTAPIDIEETLVKGLISEEKIKDKDTNSENNLFKLNPTKNSIRLKNYDSHVEVYTVLYDLLINSSWRPSDELINLSLAITTEIANKCHPFIGDQKESLDFIMKISEQFPWMLMDNPKETLKSELITNLIKIYNKTLKEDGARLRRIGRVVINLLKSGLLKPETDGIHTELVLLSGKQKQNPGLDDITTLWALMYAPYYTQPALAVLTHYISQKLWKPDEVTITNLLVELKGTNTYRAKDARKLLCCVATYGQTAMDYDKFKKLIISSVDQEYPRAIHGKAIKLLTDIASEKQGSVELKQLCINRLTEIVNDTERVHFAIMNTAHIGLLTIAINTKFKLDVKILETLTLNSKAYFSVFKASAGARSVYTLTCPPMVAQSLEKIVKLAEVTEWKPKAKFIEGLSFLVENNCEAGEKYVIALLPFMDDEEIAKITRIQHQHQVANNFNIILKNYKALAGKSDDNKTGMGLTSTANPL